MVDHIGEGTIADALNRFVNHMKRNEEPFPWAHRLSKTIDHCQPRIAFTIRGLDVSPISAT